MELYLGRGQTRSTDEMTSNKEMRIIMWQRLKRVARIPALRIILLTVLMMLGVAVFIGLLVNRVQVPPSMEMLLNLLYVLPILWAIRMLSGSNKLVIAMSVFALIAVLPLIRAITINTIEELSSRGRVATDRSSRWGWLIYSRESNNPSLRHEEVLHDAQVSLDEASGDQVKQRLDNALWQYQQDWDWSKYDAVVNDVEKHVQEHKRINGKLQSISNSAMAPSNQANPSIGNSSLIGLVAAAFVVFLLAYLLFSSTRVSAGMKVSGLTVLAVLAMAFAFWWFAFRFNWNDYRWLNGVPRATVYVLAVVIALAVLFAFLKKSIAPIALAALTVLVVLFFGSGWFGKSLEQRIKEADAVRAAQTGRSNTVQVVTTDQPIVVIKQPVQRQTVQPQPQPQAQTSTEVEVPCEEAGITVNKIGLKVICLKKTDSNGIYSYRTVRAGTVTATATATATSQ